MFALIPSITKCHGSITSKSIFLPLQQESTVDKKASWPVMIPYHHRLTIGFKKEKKYSFSFVTAEPSGDLMEELTSSDKLPGLSL